ncbi:MAG TPA: DUF3455 domain-containing protein [Puia sp.]|nr:DUF3455 domain-containing protein [Puia sp.]
MKIIRNGSMLKTVFLLMTLGLALSGYKTAGKDPVVPSNLKVPAGNKLFSHVFAKGVQIYRCTQDRTDTNRFSWIFVAPEADLYTRANYSRRVGRHYGGPTWESTDGSKVVGVKLQQADSPDPAAIPWLLLRSASDSGSGIFTKVSFIQRVNTKGGKAPTTIADRSQKGQEIRVAYTAEYFFYREAGAK